MDSRMYLDIARWLTGRLDSTLVRLQERTQEPPYYPQDMQLSQLEQKLLWDRFYASKEEEHERA